MITTINEWKKHLKTLKLNESSTPTSTYDRILDILLENDGVMTLDNIILGLAFANISKEDINANLAKLLQDGYVNLEEGTYLPTPQGYQYFKKLFNENKINENMPNQFVKDGKYTVGKHGLGCDDNVEDINNALGDEDSEHTWQYDIPEGSIVNITKFNSLIVKIEVIELGSGKVPFDMIEAEKGGTYYATEDQAFGSGNVIFINEAK